VRFEEPTAKALGEAKPSPQGRAECAEKWAKEPQGTMMRMMRIVVMVGYQGDGTNSSGR